MGPKPARNTTGVSQGVGPLTTSVLLCLFYACLSVIITCGNSLVIVSIAYFRQLRTPTNYLVLSLAVADLLVGSLICPFSMALTEASCWSHESLPCKIRAGFDIALSNSSILHLCCIAIDRYYAVCRPLSYASRINGRVAAAMILASWAASLAIGCSVTVAGLQRGKCAEGCGLDVQIAPALGCLVSFYLPACVMLCIYLKIFQVALKQAKSIRAAAAAVAAKDSGAVSKTERKATKTLAVVMGVFLMCWTPFFLCVTFQPVSSYAIPVGVIESFSWLGRSNSMLNPLVYAWFYSWFRTAFAMILSGRLHQGDCGNAKLF